MFSATAPSAAFFGSIIDKITSIISKGVAIVSVSADLAEVATYPNEYIRLQNEITRDLNEIKRVSAELHINADGLRNLASMLSSIDQSLTYTLKGFDGLLTALNSAVASMGDESAPSRPLPDIIRDIKRDHQENLGNLYRIKTAVAGLRRILGQDSATHNFSMKVGNIDLYKK